VEKRTCNNDYRMGSQQQQGSSSSMTEKVPSVEVSIIKGEAFVWSATSIAILRRNYGIVGLLTGSLPLIPQQNAFLGVPLQLFEEEVVYLLRRKAIVLVDDVKAHDVEGIAEDRLEEWHRKRVDSILNRRRLAVEEAKRAKEKNKKQYALSEVAQEKKKKREERKQTQMESINNGEEDVFQPDPSPQPNQAEEEDLSNIPHLITIPSTSSDLDWHHVRLGDTAYDTLSSAAVAGLWRYPETADERARCAAFEALKEKNYYMGKGLRFGGDFVVYPGE
jgi:tRNA-splicing endonuclease subunit Sen34